MMEGYDFIFGMLCVSGLLICASGLGWFVGSWVRYRYNFWWFIAAIILILAPIFLFPLCAELRVSAARRLNKPMQELQRNLLYRRWGWALVLCFILINLIIHTIMSCALPGVEHIAMLAFILTTMSLVVISTVWMVIYRRRDV